MLPPSDPQPPAGSAVVLFRSRAKRPCQERALVLQARGLPHRVQPEPGGFALLVPAEVGPLAVEELAAWGTENVGWPPPKAPPPRLTGGGYGALAYALLIGALFPVGLYGLFGLNFWEAGKLVAGRVTGGEWWRAVTALTLHGDFGHLVGNLVLGSAFGVLAAHTLGSGLTWLGTLLAGVGGNLVNAWIQGPEHASIGASTAVFGCLGLMMSYEWVRRHALQLPPMRRFAPMLAGAALLGYLGTGGAQLVLRGVNDPLPLAQEHPRTDVWAHVTGLAVGVVLGFAAGRARLPERLTPRAQTALAVLAVTLVAAAWVLALAA